MYPMGFIGPGRFGFFALAFLAAVICLQSTIVRVDGPVQVYQLRTLGRVVHYCPDLELGHADCVIGRDGWALD